jgi:L-lactate dehydrogenase complex protein LldE
MNKPRVALFVTCLVDTWRPSVGFAAIKLLEDAGCTVEVPMAQTCCGQPAYNSGDRANAQAIARQVIGAFRGFDYVVAPSGSCAGLISHHYPALFEETDPTALGEARELAGRTHELTAFLHDVLGIRQVAASFHGQVTYHDSCSGLRELGVQKQPRELLAKRVGVELKEMNEARVCCGFGGTFAVKYGDISTAIVDDKCANIHASGADAVVLGDLGCMLNIEGRLRRTGDTKTRVLHVAQVLSGDV